ncbi:hypothetical protein HDV05_006298, partial [Chytridiales sp. JEL 0842]
MLLILFPAALGIILPTLSVLLAGGIVVLTTIFVFGAVLPIVFLALVAAGVPTYYVYSSLKDLRDSGKIDAEKWEVVETEGGRDNFTMKGDFEEFQTGTGGISIDFSHLKKLYLDVGALVEAE